ncbi:MULTISPECIES: hypothetical protein [Butyricimonas]|jgi:hypothetical protein|uniref:Uncharacterized protein n=1 Tax=Butyricimonas hominis TaxID=2763032 RepID=A0ABR7CWH4_9BACT|nr:MULTISPECIES: hypothetical protein [Butyricimonas]MBC5619987.1 hypothetical protein [Butyricimonas hominis]MCB6973789.1 hypothetical protein [Butyricimonas synergistica]MCG4520600.1 hypothetical protein [Butyricimonas sp. DFI.6.44]
MAITVYNLLKEVGLNPTNLKRVRWGERFTCQEIGIYIISTSCDASEDRKLYSLAPIDEKILAFWLNKVSCLQLDNKRPSIQELKKRLTDFGLPDENILYIGQTENTLAKRVSQYYTTELGDAKPHAGGHWIKTLKILHDLWVYYIPCSSPKEKEEQLLACFGKQVSKDSLQGLPDKNLVLPFANLELSRGRRKMHGIRSSTLKK